MSELTALLDVQRLDNILDQLRYRHEHLSERAELLQLSTEEAGIKAASAGVDAERDNLRKRQRSLEDDAADVEAKAKDLDSRLYGGAITSPKEATVVAEEIANLKARQSELEDQSIELLVELEPLDEQLVSVEAALGEIEGRRTVLEQSLSEHGAEIDSEVEDTKSEREAVAATIDDSRLEQYRKLRITYGPRAVVEFDAGRGGGCPVAMSAVELDRWKHLPAGTLQSCVDCGRLVAKLN